MMTQLPKVAGRRRWVLLVVLVANGLAQAGAAVATALLVEDAFAAVLLPADARPSTGRLAVVCAGLAAAVLAASWLRARELVDAERLGQSYVHQLRLGMFGLLTASSSRTLQRRSQGATVLRFIGDLTALSRWISLGLARLLVATTMAIASLVALTLLSPLIGLVVTMVLLVGLTVGWVQGRGLRRAARAARRVRARLAANVTEKVGAVAVVQAFGQTASEVARVRRQSARLRRAMIVKARYAGRMRGVSEATAGAATAAVVMVGISGQVAAPTLVGALAIVGLLVSPLRDLGRVQAYWHSAAVAREKIADFLARPTGLAEPADASALGTGAGRLALEGVSLDGVLRDITATAEPGQVVAVVGPNGAGKTTLLSIVARLVDADGGRVVLDGQDLADHGSADVRAHMGLVGPDLPLLRGTVAWNLCYRWPEAPEEEVARVMELCEVGEVVDALPKGLQTKVAEGGSGLSAGQRQRLALARALLGDPALLLLDEADANLDRDASAVIDRVLARHTGTVLLITHSPERVAAADVVWHLRQGRLVEAGPPTALLEGDGPTARLFGRHLRVAG